MLKIARYVRKLCVFSGKCDDVLQLLMQYLNLDVPTYTRWLLCS